MSWKDFVRKHAIPKNSSHEKCHGYFLNVTIGYFGWPVKSGTCGNQWWYLGQKKFTVTTNQATDIVFEAQQKDLRKQLGEDASYAELTLGISKNGGEKDVTTLSASIHTKYDKLHKGMTCTATPVTHAKSRNIVTFRVACPPGVK